MPNFDENNSVASKNNESRISTVKPVTSNVVIKNDDSQKNKKKFFAEDAKTVGGHVLESVIFPSLQKLLSDMVKSGIDWLIYGSKGSQMRSGPGTVSYSSYYNRGNTIGVPTYTTPMANKPQNTIYAVNDVIFNDRGEAEEVLLRMKESISRYSMVSVADFYDLIGQRCNHTDQKYGWYNLNTADIIRVSDGYSIRFPRVQAIEQ